MATSKDLEPIFNSLRLVFGNALNIERFDEALNPARSYLESELSSVNLGEHDDIIAYLLATSFHKLISSSIGYEVAKALRYTTQAGAYASERREALTAFRLHYTSDIVSSKMSPPPSEASDDPSPTGNPVDGQVGADLDAAKRVRRDTDLVISGLAEQIARLNLLKSKLEGILADTRVARDAAKAAADVAESKTGPTGATGPKGDIGPVGPKGLTGDTGPKGDAGPVGPKGATGATGAKGDKGDTGPKGDAGPVGPKGATGATGAKGDKGDTGPRGVIGLTGPKGDKGDTGATGPAVDLSLATIKAGQVSGFGDSWKKMVWKRVADLTKTEAGFRDKSLDNSLLGTILPLRINGSVIAGFGGSRNNVLHTRNAGLLLTNASFAERRIPIDISGISSLLFVIRNYIYVYARKIVSAQILWDNKDEYDFYAFFANPMAFVPDTIDGKPTRYGYNATGVKGVGTEEGPLPPEQGS